MTDHTPDEITALVVHYRERVRFHDGLPEVRRIRRGEDTRDIHAATADLIERLSAENERLREALEPFARVAEHDIGADEDGEDVFWPMSNARYSMAGRLRVKHLRRARAALAGEVGK